MSGFGKILSKARKPLLFALLVSSLFIAVTNLHAQGTPCQYNIARLLYDIKRTTIPFEVVSVIYITSGTAYVMTIDSASVYSLFVDTMVVRSSFTADTGNFLRNLWVRGEAVLTDASVSGLLKPTTIQFLDGTFPLKTDYVILSPNGNKTGVPYLLFYSSDTSNPTPYLSAVIGAIPDQFLIQFSTGLKFIEDTHRDYFVYDYATRKFKISNEINPKFVNGLELSTTAQADGVITNRIEYGDGSISTTSASGLMGNFVLKTGDNMSGSLINGASVQANVMQTDSLTATTTIQANTVNAQEVIVSTIHGHSPTYAPEGFKFADGTVITSSQVPEGLTSSSTARVPTVYVCASDSPDELKAIANYVCNGTDDQIEISNACNSVSASGGTVLLERGIYNLKIINGGTSTIQLSSNTTLTGQGGAILKLTPNGLGSPYSTFGIKANAVNVCINNIEFQDVQAGGLSLHAIINEGEITNIRIENNKFTARDATQCRLFPINFDGGISSSVWINNNYMFLPSNVNNAVNFSETYYSHITGNYINYMIAGGNGDGIKVSAGKNTIISNNSTRLNSNTYGIQIESNCNNFIIADNMANEGKTGFYIRGSSHVITGNSAYRNSTANANISVSLSKSDVNSWDLDNAKEYNVSQSSNAWSSNISDLQSRTYNLEQSSTADHAQLNDHETRLDNVEVSSNATNTNLNDLNQFKADVGVSSNTNFTQWNNQYVSSVSANNTLNNHESRIDNAETAISAVALSTGNLQFVIGVDSTPAVNDYFGGIYNLGTDAWTLRQLCGFIDTPPTGSALIADLYISTTSTQILATISIPVSCSSGTVVNISSAVVSGQGLKGRIRQIGSTIAGSDFRITGVYTK